MLKTFKPFGNLFRTLQGCWWLLGGAISALGAWLLGFLEQRPWSDLLVLGLASFTTGAMLVVAVAAFVRLLWPPPDFSEWRKVQELYLWQEGLPENVCNLLSVGTALSELPGIGKDLAGRIAEIVTTGHFGLLDTLKKELPGDLAEIAALPGLGPKRIKILYDEFKVRTLDDLRQVIKTGRLHELRRFGPVIEQKLVAALEKPRAENASNSRLRKPKRRRSSPSSAVAAAVWWSPAAIAAAAIPLAISMSW